MAAFKAGCLSFSILCTLVALLICQIQARDIKSFSQMSHQETLSQKPGDDDNTEESVSVKSAAPVPEFTTPRVTTTATTDHGYGLYGYEQKPGRFPPTTADPAKTTTPGDVSTGTADEEKYVDGEELIQNDNADFKEFEMAAVSSDRRNNNAYYSNNNYRNYKPDYAYNNHGYNNNNNYNDNDDGDNGYTSTEYNNNDEHYNHYRNERHGIRKQQGMSDTRYLANGKYFYDLESDNNYNYNVGTLGYDPGSGVENYNYNNRVNGYRTTTASSTDYNKNHMNDNYRMSDQKQQGMSDTRFLNNGIYYHDNKRNNPQNGGYYMMNMHANNNNNNGFNRETQGRGVSYSSSHEEEDAGFGTNNPTNYKPPYEYDSVEEYEKEEEQRLAQKYGYHGP